MAPGARPSGFLIALLFLLPAIVVGFFAFATWLDKSHLVVGWRRKAFMVGLSVAVAATVLILPESSNLMERGCWQSGVYSVAARCGALLWLLGTVASLAGRGAARAFLFAWGILLFLGAFGILSVTTP